MKHLILVFVLIFGLMASNTGKAQEALKAPAIMAEICKMVELDSTQKAKLLRNSNDYAVCMDSAIYKMKDREEAAKFIFWIKKTFNEKLMKILSDQQKIEYVRNSSYPEIMDKAEVKVKVLRESGKYSDEELEKFTSEIFEYLMLEKIAYICDKYDIERQKENIAQLKKYEPQSLRTANARQKAKHQGVTYQNGYKW
jgi:hypothetical protein